MVREGVGMVSEGEGMVCEGEGMVCEGKGMVCEGEGLVCEVDGMVRLSNVKYSYIVISMIFDRKFVLDTLFGVRYRLKIAQTWLMTTGRSETGGILGVSGGKLSWR